MQFTAFEGFHRLAAGTLVEVAAAVAETRDRAVRGPVLVFDDATGAQVDLDLRGPTEEILARYQSEAADAKARSVNAPAVDSPPPAPSEPRGPGRPRLGVVAREVTLLPEHWEWLAQQRGGASVTLRRLVEQARKSGAGEARERAARNAAYQFLYAIGGNLPEYDEVSRALFAGDRGRLERLITAWPADVVTYLLAFLDR